jgi:prevent-host-death family protein
VLASDPDNPNRKGNVAEAVIAAEAIKLGVHVLKPITEHCRYDLVFEIARCLLRIQCKWVPLRGDVIPVNLAASRYTARGEMIRSTYSAEEIDAVAAYCEELDTSYLLPIELVDGMRAVCLRLTPPKNGQRAGLNWASDFELPGAVAQLGRALPWHGRGRGFESHQLHSSEEAPETEVGAHDFRNHFGWYMERASAGESFRVTRRGKPYVRLVPSVDRLPLAPPEPHKLTVVEDAEDVA